MKKILFILLCLTSAETVIYSESVQDSIITNARALIGTPYKSGGITPSGFDCSGFIGYLFKPYVKKLPRISRDIAKTGLPVKRSSLLPGDLLFFATGSSLTEVTHVALYIGQDSIIHSISNGPETGVTVSSLNAAYWDRRYHNSSRLLETEKQKEKNVLGDKTEVLNVRFAKGLYSGELVNGEPSGKGVMAMNNGDRYEGSFEGGMFHGKGKYSWADGKVFRGEFDEGKFSGSGVMSMPDGNQVPGRWREGIFYPDKTGEKSSDSGSERSESDNGRKPELVKSDNYMTVEDSPWNTYNGVVEGDFKLWFEKDMEAFEEWKKNN